MMILQLGLDIEIEIMKRLPPKSLVRFTSVSKQWKSVIRSSPFISDHRNIQQQQTSDLFFVGFSNSRNFAIIKEKQPNNLCNDEDDTGSRQPLNLPESDDDFRHCNSRCELIGYSQGLFGFFNLKDRFVIWNPSIRKSLFIPLPPDHHHAQSNYDFDYFCFTVATEPTIFYTTEPNYSSTTIEPRLRVQIYTLSAGAWRTVSYTPPRKSFRFIGQPKVTNMFIYWIVYTRNDDDSWIYVILSFDITNEQFTVLCLPPTLASSSQNTALRLSKLRESLVVLENDRSKQEIGVWMMKKESGAVENSFTRQFTVNLPAYSSNLQRYREVNVLAFTMMEPGGVQNSLTNQLIAADLINKQIWKVKVLGFTIDGQVILQMKVYPGKWQLLFYEPDSNSFMDIGKPRKKYYDLAGSYMETLLLLDH